MKYLFYKEDDRWYIHLKWNIFPQYLSEMVAGADDLLESLANGKDSITLRISDRGPIPFYDGALRLETKLGFLKGAWYKEVGGFQESDRPLQDSVWLCPITLWVLGRYPKVIYFKVVE